MLCLECPWRYDYDGNHLLTNIPDLPQLDDAQAKGERYCTLLEAHIPANDLCGADIATLKLVINSQVRVLRRYADYVTGEVDIARHGAALARPHTTLSAIRATKRLLAAFRLLHYRQRESVVEH